MALDENSGTFVVYVASFNLASGIHPDRAAQITSFFIKKVRIPDEYLDFANDFSKEKALVLLERTQLNEHVINLEDNKQLFYGPIYSLGLIKLKTLKRYIKTYLKIGFLRPSKSSISTLILFDKKPNGSLRLCVDY